MKYLYHYTSEEGFKGITLGNQLRLIRSTQSNDILDTTYIHELISDNKDLFVSDTNLGLKLCEDILFRQLNLAQSSWTTNDNERWKKAFVTCFTHKQDSRFLWNAYCNNTGYSIGFDEDEFRTFIEHHLPHTNIFSSLDMILMNELFYKREQQVGLLSDIISDSKQTMIVNSDAPIATGIDPLHIPLDNGVIEIKLKQNFIDFLNKTIESLLFVAPIIKHQFWEEEEEIRLVAYRYISDDRLTPLAYDHKGRFFINLPFPKNLIKEIILGPLNPKSIEEVKNFLQDAGYNCSNISIKKSIGSGVLRDNTSITYHSNETTNVKSPTQQKKKKKYQSTDNLNLSVPYSLLILLEI